jgi:hypothetical protein
MNQVEYRQNGVIKEHARAGVTHNLPDTFAHGGFIAMHGAFGTDRLVLLKWAFIDPLVGILAQFPALLTQPGGCTVLPVAVDMDHALHGLALAFEIGDSHYMPFSLKLQGVDISRDS